MSATSEWVTPLTRPELIESLVSGVGTRTQSNSLRLKRRSHLSLRSLQPVQCRNPRGLPLSSDSQPRIRLSRKSCYLKTVRSYSPYLDLVDPSFRYQFNPDLYNPDVVVNILVKALASVPFPDFNLSLALLDDKVSNANMEEPDPLPGLLPYLTNLHSLLQQCRFPAFWVLYRSDTLESLRDNYTVEVVGFEDSIREVALRAVKATFQKIGSKRLGSYLDLEGDLTRLLTLLC